MFFYNVLDPLEVKSGADAGDLGDRGETSAFVGVKASHPHGLGLPEAGSPESLGGEGPAQVWAFPAQMLDPDSYPYRLTHTHYHHKQRWSRQKPSYQR